MTTARRLLDWGRRRAEDVLSVLLVAMFIAFMLQIVTRYVMNAPLSWTAELSTLTWVWGILWGAGLVLRDEEEIRFDAPKSTFDPGDDSYGGWRPWRRSRRPPRGFGASREAGWFPRP